MNKFWAQERADKVEARHRAPYVISDEKTPSGAIHVGALRGVLLHDAIARILKSHGHQVQYIYGFDDFDPFNKIPAYLNQELYQPFLGKPLSTIPAPDKDGKPKKHVTANDNYGRFFADEFEAIYRALGVESETQRTSELYHRGKFNQAIEIALAKREEIAQIYRLITAHRSDDRVQVEVAPEFPLNVICQNCGKLATTKVTDWNGQVVAYQCRNDVEQWAQGCGFTGTVSPFDGNAKLPWKVEWAAKWFIWKTDLEGAGKDHYTRGGSREVAMEIFRQIFAPYLDATYHNGPEDLFYEWFQLEGAKMSTSRGVGVTAREIADQFPASILRYLILKTKPKSAVNFNFTSDSLPLAFAEYDRALDHYLKDSESNEGQIMSISLIDQNDLPKFRSKFSKLIYLVQIPYLDPQQEAEKEKGNRLTQVESKDLETRIKIAKHWLDQAPDEYRLTIQQQLPQIKLDNDQQELLKALLELYRQQSTWQGQALQQAIYDLKNQLNLDATKAFSAIYKIFLNKNSGPQAGFLLATLDREFVINRLQEAIGRS